MGYMEGFAIIIMLRIESADNENSEQPKEEKKKIGPYVIGQPC